MDIEKIKAMYAYSKEIQERSKQFNTETALSEKEALDKATEKIYDFFNAIVDSIDEDTINVKINGGCLKLRNSQGVKYAAFPFDYAELLVCSNYSGTMSNSFSKNVSIDKYFYEQLHKYYNKDRFVDYFLKNKETIEELIYNTISEKVNKKMQLTANGIQDKAAYLERLNNYVK